MKKLAIYSFVSLIFTLLYAPSAVAQTEVRLQFHRTGVKASSVTVRVLDEHGTSLEGASGSVVSSHPFRPTEYRITNAILCPQANALDKPMVELTFKLQNLPKGFQFDRVEMDVHALNGKAEYHKNNDGLARQYDMAVLTGEGAEAHLMGTLSDVDIAAGIGTADKVHGWWGVTDSSVQATDGVLNLTVRVSTGKANTGCFWGLSELVLKQTGESVPTPDEDTVEPGIYTISWKNEGQLYMAEAADGQLKVSSYAVEMPIFWEIQSGGDPQTYYIRNTATGHYIGSCNHPSGSATVVRTTAQPVRYHIGHTSATAPETSGCVYLSSTDCPHFDDEVSEPMSLNKSGSSDYIVAREAGIAHKASYWKLNASDDKYDLRPFKTSPAAGSPLYTYVITSSRGKQLEMDADRSVSWSEARAAEAQLWYVVGSGNHGSGYALVNGKFHQPLTSADGTVSSWRVLPGSGPDTYGFCPMTGSEARLQPLKVESDSLFTFRLTRTAFARQMQIYGIPCGKLGPIHVVKASVTGQVLKPMQFPMSVVKGSQLVVPDAPKPQRWYTFYTQNQATVIAGQTFSAAFTLSAAPSAQTEAYLYFDWDMDGMFETTHQLTVGQNMAHDIPVPAWVSTGKTRMRLRLTDNGLTEAEDDVVGQTFDWVVNTVDEAPEVSTLQVVVNDPSRGEVTPMTDSGQMKACEVHARPKGNAQFVCWREGRNVLSLDADYSFTLSHPTTLIACFSPNTAGGETALQATDAVDSHLIEVRADRQHIQVITQARLRRVMVFTPTGLLVAQSSSPEVDLSGTQPGLYIVKVYTDEDDKAVKLILE